MTMYNEDYDGSDHERNRRGRVLLQDQDCEECGKGADCYYDSTWLCADHFIDLFKGEIGEVELALLDGGLVGLGTIDIRTDGEECVEFVIVTVAHEMLAKPMELTIAVSKLEKIKNKNTEEK